MPFRWIMSALFVLGIHASEVHSAVSNGFIGSHTVGFEPAALLVISAALLAVARRGSSARGRHQPVRVLSRHGRREKR